MIRTAYAALIPAILTAIPALADVAEGIGFLETGDVASAAAEFQAAYEGGDGDGAFYLGRMFEIGAGTDADPGRAANLYAAGVERGSVLAMNRLGVLYQEGTVLLRDYAEASRLFCQAAEAGDANGQFNCGLAQFNGQGTERNVEQAIANWEAAAEQDNIAAQNFLGQLWLNGDEASAIAADADKARGYFQKTAEAGNALGLYQMAALEGAPNAAGEPANPVEAYKFASLAAVRGLAEAGVLRDQLEAAMTPEQVLEAQAAAKDWTEARMAEISAAAAGEAAEGEAAATAE